MSNITNIEQVTFLIQGPFLSPTTERLIKDVKSIYSCSQIVVSTWDENIPRDSGVEYVFPGDPGELKGPGEKWFNNINRLIVSTSAGLKKCSGEIIVKLRSDAIIRDSYAFKTFVDRACLIAKKTNRTCYTVYKGHYPYYPYFISDHTQVGLKSEMLMMWSADHASMEDRNYFENKLFYPSLFRYGTKALYSRWHSEQFLAINYLKCKGEISLPSDRESVGAIELLRAYALLGKYFYVFGRYESGIDSLKYKNTDGGIFDTIHFKILTKISYIKPIRSIAVIYLIFLNYLRVLKLKIRKYFKYFRRSRCE